MPMLNRGVRCWRLLIKQIRQQNSSMIIIVVFYVVSQLPGRPKGMYAPRFGSDALYASLHFPWPQEMLLPIGTPRSNTQLEALIDLRRRDFVRRRYQRLQHDGFFAEYGIQSSGLLECVLCELSISHGIIIGLCMALRCRLTVKM